MQWLVMKGNRKRNFKPDTIVNAGKNQSTAVTAWKKANPLYKGELWVFPLAHSNFYVIEKGKIISKEPYYN